MGLIHLWCVLLAVLLSYNIVDQTLDFHAGYKAIDGLPQSHTMLSMDDKVPASVSKPVLPEQEVKAVAARSTEYSIESKINKIIFNVAGQVKILFDVVLTKIKNLCKEVDRVLQLKWLGDKCVNILKQTAQDITDLLSDIVELVRFYLDYAWTKIMEFYIEYIQDYMQAILEMKKWLGGKDRKIPKKAEKTKRRQHKPGVKRVVKGKHYEYIENLERMKQLEQLLKEVMDDVLMACREVLIFYILPAFCLLGLMVAGLYYIVPDIMTSQAELIRDVVLRVYGYLTTKRGKAGISKKTRNKLRKRLHKWQK